MKVVREYRDDLVQRVRLLTYTVAALLVLIAAGFWFVQIVQGDYYRELADNNRLRKLPIQAPRGLMLDRNGRILVENIPSYNLMIDRSRSADVKRSLAFAAEVLGRPPAEMAALMEHYRGIQDFKPVLVGENLSLAQVARIGVANLEYPEFEVEVQNFRLYRHGAQTAHVLGYLGEATLEEVEDAGGRLAGGDMVGKKGLEKRYDAQLRGRDGERVVVVDSRGQLLQEYGKQPAVPGANLTLTLDLDLQEEAAHWLDGPEKVGAIVAMDPRNGEILALVSSPSFNSNLFSRRLQADDWKALIEEPYNPLQDRALQNTYSPGSTFKIVMATAGLAEGVIGEHDRVFCPGGRSSTTTPSAAGASRGTARSTSTMPSSTPATSSSTTSASGWGSSASPATPASSGWARPPASTSRARSAGWCRTRRGAWRPARRRGIRARRSRSPSARGRCC